MVPAERRPLRNGAGQVAVQVRIPNAAEPTEAVAQHQAVEVERLLDTRILPADVLGVGDALGSKADERV
jgi:hypothetical protein